MRVRYTEPLCYTAFLYDKKHSFSAPINILASSRREDNWAVRKEAHSSTTSSPARHVTHRLVYLRTLSSPLKYTSSNNNDLCSQKVTYQ